MQSLTSHTTTLLLPPPPPLPLLLLLQGVLFHDRMKSSELEKVRPQLLELEETFMAVQTEAGLAGRGLCR
jgi:hypothetical protein